MGNFGTPEIIGALFLSIIALAEKVIFGTLRCISDFVSFFPCSRVFGFVS